MKLRKPHISLETKLRVITDYNTKGMAIEDILKRNKVSLASMYRIIKEKMEEHET